MGLAETVGEQLHSISLKGVASNTWMYVGIVLVIGLIVCIIAGIMMFLMTYKKRVVIFEKTNARNLTPDQINEPVDGAVIDVSFISLKIIIPVITRLLPGDSFIVALIKPQFEAGKEQVGKGGVIKDPDLHQSIVNNIKEFCIDTGWNVEGCIPSPILGPKGNREFLIYLKGHTSPLP